MYFSSLQVAAISAAAPASKAALSMYDSASGHVTSRDSRPSTTTCRSDKEQEWRHLAFPRQYGIASSAL